MKEEMEKMRKDDDHYNVSWTREEGCSTQKIISVLLFSIWYHLETNFIIFIFIEVSEMKLEFAILFFLCILMIVNAGKQGRSVYA